MDNSKFNIFELENSSDKRNEHNEKFTVNLRIKMEEKVLNEVCAFFPNEENNKYPRAVQLLFAGKRQFTVYFSNASNDSFEDSINILLATDVDNKENNLVLNYLDNMTLSFFGYQNNSWFTITKILRVPKLVGSKNNRTIKANVTFFYNHDISAYGLPDKLYKLIMDLPNNLSETKIINERISHWDEYLKINEKIAKETQVLLKYSGYKQNDNIMQIIFMIRSGDITSKHNNSSIQLVFDEEIEDNQISYKGPIIGTISRINNRTNELVVDFDFDFWEVWTSGNAVIPPSGELFVTKLGDLVQIRRLRNGLKTFARGQAVNPYLDVFMFDSTKARDLGNKSTKLSEEDLLQKNLNREQIIAVEGVINSKDLFLIQGPPGTGKTTVIAEICYQNAIRNKKTLIASQTNLAVDNALSKLIHHPKIRALRKGNEQSVQEEGILFTENNIIETWLKKTANDCTKLIKVKKANIEKVEKTEKELVDTVVMYKRFVNSTEKLKLNEELMLINQEKIDLLKSQISWLEENYKYFIDDVMCNAYDNIVNSSYLVGDAFIDIAKAIRTTTIENKQKRKSIETNISNYQEEIKILLSSIEGVNRIFNRANSKTKFIVVDENRIEGYLYSVSEWQNEARALEDEINHVNHKKPFYLFVLLGLANKWMLSVCSVINKYNKFKVSTELTILNEKKNLETLLLDKKIESFLNTLKDLYNRKCFEIEQNLKEINVIIQDIEVEISNDTNVVKETTEFISNFNQNLPYGIIPESIERISQSDDITNYYTSLWKHRIEDDKKYVQLIKEWVQRIEGNVEEDYKSFKKLYIENANVIGITCSQSGSKEFTEQYPTFDVAIIDEVSKATPPELILPVLKAKKIVLVGDHKQLPPMIGMETYEEVAKQLDIPDDKTKHMKMSLFEELYRNAPINLKVMLNIQYRMHTQIMDSINQFYKDENEMGLVCGIQTPDLFRKHYCHGKAIDDSNHIIWVDIPLTKDNYEEQSYTNYSYQNRTEVDCIKDILLIISTNLFLNNYSGSKKIGVISFYSNQVRLLEKELLDKNFADQISNISLRIGSVDKFQGIECPVVICSFVRNNPNGEIGFAKDPRRINVALSRAQELSIIVGCSELFCSTNRNSGATELYQTIAGTILEAGGIKNAMDFR